MPHSPAVSGARPVHSLFNLVLAAAVLYLARAVFIPVALAVLVAFVLAPLVRSLERKGLGRIPAVGAALSFSVSIVIGFFALLMNQLFDLLNRLPEHKETISAKLQLLSAAWQWTQITKLVQSLGIGDTGGGAGEGIAVRIVDVPSGPLEIAQLILGPVLEPLAIGGIVVVFVAVMLLTWDDLRDRLLRLSGQNRLNITTQALEETSDRVSRYLQTQLLINALTGFAVGVGTWLIGLPYAPLWGVLAMTLRFIPYIGPWAAATLPLLTAFATTEGFQTVLLTLGLLVVTELVSNNVLEPWLYGTRTGLSPLGVLVSFVFWGWLWGGVGLLLATPLTVCLSVAGHYIPQLEIFNILLSDRRALPIAARIYHRLLALDPDEASALVEEARGRQASLAAFFDDALIPAVSLAERDRHNDSLPQERQKVIYEALQGFVEEEQASTAKDDSATQRPASVLILAADDQADTLAALMLQQVLAAKDVVSFVVDHQTASSDLISKIAVSKPAAVIVSALPPLATIAARRMCQKIQALFPQVPVLVGHWQKQALAEGNAMRLVNAGAKEVVTSMTEMEARVLKLQHDV